MIQKTTAGRSTAPANRPSEYLTLIRASNTGATHHGSPGIQLSVIIYKAVLGNPQCMRSLSVLSVVD